MNFRQWITEFLSRFAQSITKPNPVPVPVPVPTPIPVANPADPNRVVVLMNEIRKSHDLPEFVRDARLDASALGHCNAMVATGVFSHQCPGESEFDIRIIDQGYHWTYASENIAAGQSSADEVVSDWMNESPPNDGHRKAILGPAQNIGTAVTYSSQTEWKWYWTVDFASQ